MMRSAVLASVATAACGGGGAAVIGPSPGATLTVVNLSAFTIVDIRLAPVDSPDFGPNLLAGDILAPGEQLTLDVPCDFYDAHVLDESGAECDLRDLDLCANDATWVLTNDACPVFGARSRGSSTPARADRP